MIIVCAGMSRSGSTVQYQLIKEFIERTGNGFGMGSWSATKVKKVAKNEITVFKSERARPNTSHLIDHIFSVIRNPFDVAVSLYRYRMAKEYYTCQQKNTTLSDIIRGELTEVMGWIQFWINNDANILRYEDLHPDNWGQVIRQASQVLDIEADEKLISEIVKEYSLENNSYRIKYLEQWFDNTDTMLTLAHIGPEKGKIGQGKRLLFDHQKEMITSCYSDFMEEYGYL